MSDQVLDTEQVEEAEVDQTVPDFVQQLNDAVAAKYADETEEQEPQPDEEASGDASTEPPDEEPASDEVDEPEPEQPSQTDEMEAYARRVAQVLRERPDLAEAMVALERGDAVPVPREVYEASQRQQQPEPEQAQPLESDFWEDPEAKFRSLEERVAAYEAHIERQTQAQRQAEDRSNLSLIESVGEEFRSRHPELSEEQFFRDLVPTIAKTNLIRMFREEHPGDPRKAVDAAFESAFRMKYPEHFQAAQVNKQVREHRRKQRAGATAASPRSVSRTQEEPKNKQERTAAIADMIRDSQQANA